ncbi:PilZ domain-containing protein [Pseudobacteriovorax antillogorgiicola]|uniref:PilZ domain-containing protein n=1 Tax=Pseudobacteriovorax antillogorgiicola TaxID=1513793 RepID=A0A1Y6BLR5_9BACT|nr:PilZ domain-containing protein [Pseudobacteriovorax antillogorgiicola]TCS56295.1 PilZ domain-containing protein [Pseudobacteriovorax antillogorgiicola]SMF07420.1 PilZ domain-containing protein [Pseudobacteriovorax antillogorgiicola]
MSKSSNPGEKLVMSMLQCMDRYSVEQAISSTPLRPKNPLNITFSEISSLNQRQHDRLSMGAQVNLNKGEIYIIGDCKDISASGMFLACYPDENIFVNDTVHLIIKLETGEQVFRAKARVARQERNGYALKFITAS